MKWLFLLDIYVHTNFCQRHTVVMYRSVSTKAMWSPDVVFIFAGFRGRFIIYSNTDRPYLNEREIVEKSFSSSASRSGGRGLRQYYSISVPESDWAGGLEIQFERSKRRVGVMGTVGVKPVLHPNRLACNPIREKTPRGASRSPPLTHSQRK